MIKCPFKLDKIVSKSWKSKSIISLDAKCLIESSLPDSLETLNQNGGLKFCRQM